MTETSPIVGAIEVIQQGPTGVTALVDGQRQVFNDLDAVFRTAIRLLDEKTRSHARPAPSPRRGIAGRPLHLPGLAP